MTAYDAKKNIYIYILLNVTNNNGMIFVIENKCVFVV